MSESVFLQSPRNYRDYTHVLRNMVYSTVDVERFLQKYDSTITLYPVVIDEELTNTGNKSGSNRLIGFNYHLRTGLEHFVAYCVVYQAARRFQSHYYYNGYEMHWGIRDYDNFINVHTHKAAEGRSKESGELQHWLFGLCAGRINEIFK